MRSFGSDNHSGIHTLVFQGIADANKDHAMPYGADTYTDRLREAFRGMLGPHAEAYPVFSGTGANVLALRMLTRRYDAVVCASSAHINENETGAPEALNGCKLLTVPAPDGKLTPDMLLPMLGLMGNPHKAQPRVVSITQPTEVGTLYTVGEIAALADFAHENGMFLHMDGARLGNAVASLGVDVRAMTTDAGVDALSFGGTKNGLMCGEVVVFLKKGLGEGTLCGRKQITQLASKMRFISAQFLAYLKDDLWLETAAHSNRMASLLAGEIAKIKGVELTQKVEANAVFVRMPRAAADKLQPAWAFNVFGSDPCVCRLLCSFDTTEEDVAAFISDLKEALG